MKSMQMIEIITIVLSYILQYSVYLLSSIVHRILFYCFIGGTKEHIENSTGVVCDLELTYFVNDFQSSAGPVATHTHTLISRFLAKLKKMLSTHCHNISSVMKIV